MKEDDKCPHCGKDKLVLIPETFPYSVEHLMYPACDSTYNITKEVR